jgi:hypothetical protein
MIAATHPVAPEEVMAYLDGELSQAKAQAVSTHLDQCSECGDLAAQFRATSQALSGWTVPPVPASLEESVMVQATNAAAGRKLAKPGRSSQITFWNMRLWAVSGAVAALLLVAVVSNSFRAHREVAFVAPEAEMYKEARSAGKPIAQDKSIAAMNEPRVMNSLQAPTRSPQDAAKTEGLIATNADTRAFSASAPLIDSILARHHGYAAQLTAATAENAPRSLQASLRIPAPELAAALADLKAIGRVENESQSGEEVTQQHADLVARLKNSRETEERLRAILEQRTGKIEDILQVEEEIARVRGEIEQMEAEQQALEHRVDFASVELELVEDYKAQLNPPAPSISNRIHNAFVSGVRNAAEMLLGFVLFVEEDGPILLIWLAILGLPVILLWRRYRRMKARM